MSAKKAKLDRSQVAHLVAADTQGDAEIAAAAGITDRTLRRWKRAADFDALVREAKEQLKAAAAAKSIATRARRLAILDDQVAGLLQVIAERAELEAKIAREDPERAIPGGATGHVVRQYKQIGVGVRAERVEEHVVDVGTMAEIRATLKQAAQEVGDWTEKRDVTSGGDKVGSFADLFLLARGDTGASADGPGPVPE